MCPRLTHSIIMDFAPQGDIAAVIKQHAVVKRPLPEDLIWKYLIQVGSLSRWSRGERGTPRAAKASATPGRHGCFVLPNRG